MKTIDPKSFLLGLILAGGIILFLSSSQDNAASGGRYQIVNITSSYLTNTAFVLDTQTGAVVKINIDKSVEGKTGYIPGAVIRDSLEKDE